MSKQRPLILLFACVGALTFVGCRSSSGDGNAANGLFVVNAPASGKVGRVLVSEGSEIAANAGIVEIVVASNAPASTGDNPLEGARQDSQTVQTEIKAAEAELERASVEVERVAPMVASNGAPSAQLDAARAQYQTAQDKLDAARKRGQSSQANLAIRQGGAFPATETAKENVVAVRAPVAGNVRVISASVGQIVKAGQPIATIAAK